MKLNIEVILFALLLTVQAHESKATFGAIKLMEGYSAEKGSAVDAAAWTIEGKNGLRIEFEAGANEGSWADPNDRHTYSWYREQTINGYQARFAMIRSGLKTHWEPTDSRGLPPGNILLVTFLLNGPKSDYTANFSAKVASPEETMDMLIMVATFDPKKSML